jgi:hypothetical protein
MSVKKYKFISPGVFINEIDNSALPATPTAIGPLVIGQTRRGPGMRPIRVNSFSEFIDVFGTPAAGVAPADAWRNGAGIISSPTYASYTAQAWLQNNSPITVVRLLGSDHLETTSAGYAGWQTEKEASTSALTADQAGAFGLFICASSSTDSMTAADTAPSTGSLAAIFYCNSGSYARLQGNLRGDTAHPTASACTPIYSKGTNHQFSLEMISGAEGAEVTESFSFNFDRTSPSYIRKVFNTNPALTNATTTTSPKAYWLGETYDQFLKDKVGSGGANRAAAGTTHQGASIGIIFQLQTTDGAIAFGNRRISHRPSQTGWIFAQHQGSYTDFNVATQTKLFKLHSRNAGTYEQNNLKVSIEDIRPPKNAQNPYSTFTLTLRMITDNDGKTKKVESYTGLNMNPGSADYIANRIGDKFVDFDDISRKNKEYGKFDNASEFVRVEMHPDVEDSGPEDPEMVPFGFFGPPRFKGFTLLDNTRAAKQFYPIAAQVGDAAYANTAVTGLPVVGAKSGLYHGLVSSDTANTTLAVRESFILGSVQFTASFNFPTMLTRVSSSDSSLPSDATAYHGWMTHQSSGSGVHDDGMMDLLSGMPDRSLNAAGTAAVFADHANLAANLEIPVIFSLDEVTTGSAGSTSQTSHVYVSGSRILGHSLSSDPVGYVKGASTKFGWEATVLYGANSFTLPLFGGVDGVNVREKDPFGHHILKDETEKTSYAYNSVKKAMDLVSDVEDIEYNVITAPNIKAASLTQHLIDMAENRGDALAVIDIEHDYTPSAESKGTFKSRVGDTDAAVKALKDRNIDSSFAAAYYPYVQIVDKFTNTKLFVPPSVAALGVLSNTERASKIWFAPAGFSRGGLSQGAAGIPVLNVVQKLSKKERDLLYEAGINPIASFPSEGLVVFGQKTLQATPSALDRINVRRLLIFLKKKISRIANGVLFDQNSKVTWNRFTGQVEPFLRSVQAGLGLEDFKVVLDDTTTTPDLVDRNVLYAKIFLKPTKSIEYIAIDFNITNQGAAFDD